MATIKQKLAFKEVLKGSTISKAMIKAKYSPTTASTTGKLTNTKGWQELMDKFISDDDLAKRHNEQLNSSKLLKLYFDIDDDDAMIQGVCSKLGVELLYIKINKNNTGKTANVKAPDFFFRDLAIDKGYKIKGRYANAEDPNANKILIINVTNETAKRYGLQPTPITESSSD